MNSGIQGRMRMKRRAIRQYLVESVRGKLAYDCVEPTIWIMPVSGGGISKCLFNNVHPVMADSPTGRHQRHSFGPPASDNIELCFLAPRRKIEARKFVVWVNLLRIADSRISKTLEDCDDQRPKSVAD